MASINTSAPVAFVEFDTHAWPSSSHLLDFLTESYGPLPARWGAAVEVEHNEDILHIEDVSIRLEKRSPEELALHLLGRVSVLHAEVESLRVEVAALRRERETGVSPFATSVGPIDDGSIAKPPQGGSGMMPKPPKDRPSPTPIPSSGMDFVEGRARRPRTDKKTRFKKWVRLRLPW